MNNLIDVHYLLGRQHIEERLRGRCAVPNPFFDGGTP